MSHKSIRSAIISLLLLSFLAISAPRQASADQIGLRGTVVNLATDVPISGVKVSAGGLYALTDSEGCFALTLPPGLYDVRAQAPGYVGMTHAGFQVLDGRQAVLDLAMVPAHPSKDEAAVIDARLLQPSQESVTTAAPSTTAHAFAPSQVTKPPATIRVLMPDQTVVTMDMDEYLKGVVPQEMSPYWPPEALKAQAVAARSYAATSAAHLDAGADVCTTTHCQVWTPVHYDTTDAAVDSTSGVTAKYDGGVIRAFFFGHCDGHTRSCEDVWGGSLPYCRSVTCSCTYSTLWGHGVGMCQAGAKAMAEQGATYVEILQHYYSGVVVVGGDLPFATGAGVSPSSGDEGTLYVFEAVYYGTEDTPPAVANVIIDGHAHALTYTPDATADGRVYRYETYLSASPHTYAYRFVDANGLAAQWPASSETAGPSVSPGGTPGSPSGSGGISAASITYSTELDWAQGVSDGVAVTAKGDGAVALMADYPTGIHTMDPVHAPVSFVALGIDWYGSTTDATTMVLDVRVSGDGAAWTDWQRVLPAQDESQDASATPASLFFGLGEWVQIRVAMSRDAYGVSPVLENLRIVCIDATEGGTAAELAAAAESPGDEAPPVISRAQWGADEALMTYPPEYATVQAMILHHTATNDGGVDSAQMVRAIYYYHAVVREWGDIGYNYVIDAYGNVYEGRYGGSGAVGHHAGAYNEGSLGVGVIGNYQETDLPDDAVDSLTSLLAWQCAQNWIQPDGQVYLIDRQVPAILGHRDVAATQCPGDRAYTLLPAIRSETLAKTANITPVLRMSHPTDGQALSGVVSISLETSVAVSSTGIYVDGESRVLSPAGEGIYIWDTTRENDGAHALRIVVANAGGQAESTLDVLVDNTPPSGTASVPVWSTSLLVPVDVQTSDAAYVQFSNGWAWEGEALRHQDGTGAAVSDPDAFGGTAWLGRGGTDAPGWWYGPYTLNLIPWRDYQAYFRIKTPDAGEMVEIARLDVADNQGLRVYAEASVLGSDFASANVYREVPLSFAYQSTSATWEGLENGLEFRTWFPALGDFYLDRVSVFDAPQPLTGSVAVRVLAKEGTQEVRVRLLDEAGNWADTAVTVGLDLAAPEWLEVTATSALVQDTISGLDLATAEWSSTADGGLTWEEWQPLSVDAQQGTVVPVLLQVPGTVKCARFRIQDVAGNATQVTYATWRPDPTGTAPSPEPRFQISLVYKGWDQ